MSIRLQWWRLILCIPVFFYFSGFSQKDSLVFTNGDYLVGEIKGLEQGVITVKTYYSDSDFKAEWKKVSKIFSQTLCLVTLSDGTRFEGRLQSVNPEQVRLYSTTEELLVLRRRIVLLQTIKEKFKDRIDAAISLGYSFTRAENLQQITVIGKLGYNAERWGVNMTFNTINSTQNNVDPIRRLDSEFSFRYFLPKDWYLIPQVSFLSNTEQDLNLRVSSRFGVGKFVIHSNRSYLGFVGGINYNYENFARLDTMEVPPRTFNETGNSAELYLGSELNLFDYKNIELLTGITAYPSLTIRRRWRVDYNLNFKYDLPLEFFIQVGLTLNFDNQASNRTDYVFQTTFGWDW